MHVSLDELMEDCEGDEHLTDFVKDLIQISEDDAEKLSEIGI